MRESLADLHGKVASMEKGLKVYSLLTLKPSTLSPKPSTRNPQSYSLKPLHQGQGPSLPAPLGLRWCLTLGVQSVSFLFFFVSI